MRTAPADNTVKRLFAKSGGVCAFPGCRTRLVHPESGVLLGELCHICAASPGGPRYEPARAAVGSSNEEQNLIILCPTHHRLIDQDLSTYTCDVLGAMKARHEARVAASWNTLDEIDDRQATEFARQVAGESIDFAIIVAIPDELAALHHYFPELKAEPPEDPSYRSYFRATLATAEGASYRVVATSLSSIGNSAAAVETAELVRRWNPRFVLVSGLAGGFSEQDQRLGDIVVSSSIVYYGRGNRAFSVDRTLLAGIDRLTTSDWRMRLPPRPDGELPSPLAPRVHVGPIASGDTLTASANETARPSASYRHVVAIEMESAGVASAFSAVKKVGFLTIRAISDFVDTSKTSQWREYAAHSAASYLRAFLDARPVSPSEGAWPDPLPPVAVAPTPDSTALRRKLFERLCAAVDMEEFKTLCFLVGVDVDELPGDRKSARVRELILSFERRGNLQLLEAAVDESPWREMKSQVDTAAATSDPGDPTDRANETIAKDTTPPDGAMALIMKGGGVKGLALAGALIELEKHYRFDVFVGTSAGAIAAVLLAAGFNATELERRLREKDFSEFLDTSRMSRLKNLMFHRALHSGDPLEEWVRQLIAEKIAKQTRVEMRDLVGRAIVYAANEERGTITFDSKGENDNAPADFAVRCSMSIPGFFVSRQHHGISIFDGGLLNNFPVQIFVQQFPKHQFIGLYLSTGEVSSKPNKSLISTLLNIVTGRDERVVVDKHKAQMVIIDPSPIKTTQFHLDAAAKDLLVWRGRLAALRFLHGQNPPKATRDEVASCAAKVDELHDTVNRVGPSGKRQSKRGSVVVLSLLVVLGVAVFRFQSNRPTEISLGRSGIAYVGEKIGALVQEAEASCRDSPSARWLAGRQCVKPRVVEDAVRDLVVCPSEEISLRYVDPMDGLSELARRHVSCLSFEVNDGWYVLSVKPNTTTPVQDSAGVTRLLCGCGTIEAEKVKNLR